MRDTAITLIVLLGLLALARNGKSGHFMDALSGAAVLPQDGGSSGGSSAAGQQLPTIELASLSQQGAPATTGAPAWSPNQTPLPTGGAKIA